MKKKIRRISKYKGLPLIDATKDLEICVSEKDVSNSKKNDPSNCAAANAAKRILKAEVEVHISRVYVKNKNHWIRFLTPQSISREVTSFDRGASFEPGNYVIKAPSTGQKLGYYKISRHTETNKGKKLIGKRHITANIRESAR
jgi:hypothetical protein